MEGKFNILRVPPGDYALSVTYIGYQVTEVPVSVEINRTTIVDVKLVFEVVEGEYEGSICDCFVNMANGRGYGLGNKLGKIANALKGKVELGDYFNIYDLINKECYGNIVLQKGKQLINRIITWNPIEKT